jgi:hypothetical protein
VPPAFVGLLEVLGGIFLSLNADGWGWNVAGAICLGAGLVLFIIAESWRRETVKGARSERGNFTVLLADALLPLIRRLGTMPKRDSAGRSNVLEKVLGSVAMAAPALLPHAGRLRVVVYRLEPARGSRPRRLVPDTFGRKDHAKTLSEGDGGRGDAVFAVLTSGEADFVADVTKADLQGRARSGKKYQTFISAAITADDQAFGVLNVDAPRPGDLDEGDIVAVELLAELAGTAFAMADK